MSILGLSDKQTESVETPEQLAKIEKIKNQAITILIASGISILFCGLFGIIATYFAYQGKQAADYGNIDVASYNISKAKSWMIAGFILGILGLIGKLTLSK